MANFQNAINFALQNEDSTRAYKTVPDSPPGAYAISGINSKSFPKEFAYINSLPQEKRGPEVEGFYKTHFWNSWCEQLISDELGCRVLDSAINAGSNTTVKILQKAVNSITPGILKEDGEWGPNTLLSVNKTDQNKLLSAFKQKRIEHYEIIVENNPSLQKYLQIWKMRAAK